MTEQTEKSKLKCDICGKPATNEAFEQAKPPIEGAKPVSTGKVLRGCDKHPASKRVRRS